MKARPGPDGTRLAYSTEAGDLRTSPRAAPRRAPAPAPPSPGVRLRLDRRASGRVVTVVSGLPGRTEEILALARELKTSCGTGGTVKDGALELMGDHRTAVEAALTARGIRSKRSGG